MCSSDLVVRFRDSQGEVGAAESAMCPQGASPVGEAFPVVEFRREVGVFLAAAAFPRGEDRVPHGNRLFMGGLQPRSPKFPSGRCHRLRRSLPEPVCFLRPRISESSVGEDSRHSRTHGRERLSVASDRRRLASALRLVKTATVLPNGRGSTQTSGIWATHSRVVRQPVCSIRAKIGRAHV